MVARWHIFIPKIIFWENFEGLGGAMEDVGIVYGHLVLFKSI
jgi:hypothetical protein